MLETRFSEKEMTELCKLLRNHGTNCKTLIEILELAYRSYPNDAMNTYKHVILLKEIGIINDRDILCNTCSYEVIEEHANTCEEHKRRMNDDKYFFPCPDEHYDYSKCEPAVWMIDFWKIQNLTKNKCYDEETKILTETFVDMHKEIIHNHPHFLCEKHIGSMKPYANKIMGYR